MSRSLLCPQKKIELVMELLKGKEYANQLLGNEGLALGQELAQKVLRSFTNSLAKVSLCRTNNFGESGKKRPAEIMKDKRGSYKRRKEVNSWVIVTPTVEDGYSWRKYGQKDIQNSKHPRCYFRCTHKFDQDCKAQKQVEKIEGYGNNMYQTTYINQHTCKDQMMTQTITDSEVTHSTSMIDFRVITPANNSLHHNIPRNKTFVPPTIIKQESNGDTKSDLTDNVSSIDSCAMWPTLGDTDGLTKAPSSSEKRVDVGSSLAASVPDNHPEGPETSGTRDYSPEMRSLHDQEVASTLYGRDASSIEDLDIKTLIGDKFPDFPFEEL